MKHKKQKKVQGLLNRPLVEQTVAYGVAALVVGVVAYIGVLTQEAELTAARPPTLETAIQNADEGPKKISLILKGSNFEQETTVALGGRVVSDVTYISPTTLRAVAALYAYNGSTIKITNPDGQFVEYTGAPQATVPEKVNAIKLSVLMSRIHTDYPPLDLDGDGIVNLQDMAVMQGAWTW